MQHAKPYKSSAAVYRLTWAEKNESFQAAVLGRVHVEGFEFFHLFLEDAYMIHEGDNTVSGHWAGVETGGGQ